MATITQKDIVDTIIRNNGHYEDDELVVKIVEYNNMFDGRVAWGLIYESEDLMRYHNSGACRNPRTIWERDSLYGSVGTADSEEGRKVRRWQ